MYGHRARGTECQVDLMECQRYTYFTRPITHRPESAKRELVRDEAPIDKLKKNEGKEEYPRHPGGGLMGLIFLITVIIRKANEDIYIVLYRGALR